MSAVRTIIALAVALHLPRHKRVAQEYLLFVDTETTGLPARWQRPYREEWEWPSIAQLAWQVYTPEGQLVKAEQAYLQIPAGRMPAEAIAIHGLTPEFLAAHGQLPAPVLQQLLDDLQTYRPRVVGHFLPLDFHVLGAALLRAELPNPLPDLPQFCTMQLTAGLGLNPKPRQLLLHELYELLFGESMICLHDAQIDAAATARCYFELRRRGLIPDNVLNGQPRLGPPELPAPRPWSWGAWLALAVAGLLLCYWLLYG
ncbi:3'-5' exonuclease [Hymenobacter sp. CRA2]|uniref:3'-5' exonuclease n=1 Tax=Hymenobacter sp. CRA2 TaxID=1955620 RepID=UPI00098EA3DD|nr:3'-5' exonuclease [Hymenobacter sp. CRA2]OON70299.1 hypothetical protein B0919_06090 [Hymenobacter sp. CRA2]